jgi:hypothetical protein
MKIKDYQTVRRYHAVFSPEETYRIRSAGLYPLATCRYGNDRSRAPMLELYLTRSDLQRIRQYLDCTGEEMEAMLAAAPYNAGNSCIPAGHSPGQGGEGR